MTEKIISGIRILLMSSFISLSGYGTLMAGEDTAVLKAIIGAVDYFAKGSTAWQPAKEGSQLSSGDKIKTSADGMASVSFAGGSQIMLKPDTEFEITSLNRSEDKSSIDYKLQFNMGKLRAMAEKLNSDSSFEIKTPAAVTAIRGTVYYLEVRKLKPEEAAREIKASLITKLFVKDGEITYTNIFSGKYFTVHAGQGSNSYDNGNIDSPFDVPSNEQLEWTQGWNVILQAEPYQEPGDGRNPDLSTNTGGDRGNLDDLLRQSGQRSKAKNELFADDARSASKAAAEAAIRAGKAAYNASSAAIDVHNTNNDLSNAKNRMNAAYYGEGGAYQAFLLTGNKYSGASQLVLDAQDAMNTIAATKPRDPFGDAFELLTNIEIPEDFRIPGNIEDWRLSVTLRGYWGFSEKELENVDYSFSAFLSALSNKILAKKDTIEEKFDNVRESNDLLTGRLGETAANALLRANELSNLAQQLEAAIACASRSSAEAAYESISVLAKLTREAIENTNTAAGTADSAAASAQNAMKEARLVIAQAKALISAAESILADTPPLKAAFDAVTADCEDLNANTANMKDAVIVSVKTDEAAKKAYEASANAQGAEDKIDIKKGLMNSADDGMTAAYTTALLTLYGTTGKSAEELYDAAWDKADDAQDVIDDATDDVDDEVSKVSNYMIADIPAARNQIDIYQARLDDISADIDMLDETLDSLDAKLLDENTGGIYYRFQHGTDDASSWGNTASKLTNEIREAGAAAETKGDDAILAIMRILVKFTREAINNANTAANAANSAANEAETMLAGAPALLSRADALITSLNTLKTELTTLKNTQLAGAINTANGLTNSAQAITSDEDLADIITFERQREKDAVKEKLHSTLLDRSYLRAQVRSILEGNDLRRLDGYLEKISDAQAGKVIKDVYGNRVRVDQYILRPSSDTVEFLNVNLRAGGDLTTLSWTAAFNASLDTLPTGQLKNLPWNDYLETHYDNNAPAYIDRPYNSAEIYYPTAMAATLSHADDFFTESKNFDGREKQKDGNDWVWRQSISNQTLLVHNFNNDAPMPYAKQSHGSQPAGTYSIASALRNAAVGGTNNNPRGFRYDYADAAGLTNDINAAFYVVSDDFGRQDDYKNISITDIGDALRVNMPGSAKNIGNNNLEMVFSSSSSVFRDGQIDLIYAPTERMSWKPDDNIPGYSWP